MKAEERSGAPARVFCAWCGSEEPDEGPPCPLYPTDAVCPKCGHDEVWPEPPPYVRCARCWHDFAWEGWS